MKHRPDFEILEASLETSNNMELPGTYAWMTRTEMVNSAQSFKERMEISDA
jgi:hypothetical protein